MPTSSNLYLCQLPKSFSASTVDKANLKRKGEWEDWVKEMEEKRWEAVLAEYESEMNLQDSSKGAFDKTVANAIANHEHNI